jgi:hypothetical protein
MTAFFDERDLDHSLSPQVQQGINSHFLRQKSLALHQACPAIGDCLYLHARRGVRDAQRWSLCRRSDGLQALMKNVQLAAPSAP